MNNVNILFVISAVFVPLLLISISYSAIQDYYTYSVPLNKMILFEDPLFNDPDKFIEISEKKDSKCFTSPSMNYFCYAKPRMYESGIGVSWLISNTTKISGELHFDNVNVGPSYFTMKNMTLIQGDTAKITFADKDYRVGNGTSTLYEITNDFEFTTIIEKFDTFVAKCDNYDGTSVTVVQYLGITTIDGVDYFMTWHLNALSEEGIVCDYPQIIQNSFDNDFGNIGHDGEEIENDVINTEPESTPPPEPPFDSKEHYVIEITGLKDVYIVGERYDFSYILSGYGHSCGGKTVTFPDSNGDTIGNASSASCIANLPMGIFVFDIEKEQGTTYGHVEMKNPGTYTVTVTFDRPSQYFPTTASQEFRVVEE